MVKLHILWRQLRFSAWYDQFATALVFAATPFISPFVFAWLFRVCSPRWWIGVRILYQFFPCRINNLSIFHLMQIVQTLCGIVKLVYNKIKWKKILPSVHANFRSILLNANMKVMLLLHLIQTTQPKLCSVSFFYHILPSLWMIVIYLRLFWTHVKWMNTFVHQHMAVNSQLFV